MASIVQHAELRPEIDGALSSLRRRIRAYVLLEGTALVLVVLGVLFWLSLGLNWGYFKVSNLELPRWFRATFVFTSLTVAALVALVWVVHRLVRRMQTKALALVLERRFPDLDDRLITAVEASESRTGRETRLSELLLSRTIDDAARAADALPVREVFRRTPLATALAAAGVLLASVIALAATNAQAMRDWANAYWFLEDEYWDRDTLMVARVVAQPSDEIREFESTEEAFVYKHPRGGDLELVIEVPEYNDAGKPLVVPEEIEVRYRLESGARGTVSRRPSTAGGREFRHTFAEQQEDVTFWIKGGDFVNRKPYRVVMVSQPQIESTVLRCDFPDYTGMDDRPGARDVAVVLNKVGVPLETRFTMSATANKPLVRVRLQTERFEIALTPETSRLTIFSQDGAPQREVELPRGSAGATLAPDGRHFEVPFFASVHVPSEAARCFGRLLSGGAAVPDAVAGIASTGAPLPVLLGARTQFRLFLRDIDGVENIEPARLTIESIPDQPPRFDGIAHKGIGDIITRNALIPISGTIRDDYGVLGAWFEYRVDEAGDWLPAHDAAEDYGPHRFVNPPRAEQGTGQYPTEFSFRTPKRAELLIGDETDEEKFENAERFSVMPLNLDLGQTLSLRVRAEDGDTINGPHAEHSTPEFRFTVVTEDELLGYLHEREVNLRLEFEKAIKEIRAAEQDLAAALAMRESASASATDKDNALAQAASRALQTVKKNRESSRGTEAGFSGILDELLNNQLRTGTQVARLKDLIIRPLHEVNESHFHRTDLALGALDVVLRDGNDPTGDAGRSLSEMRNLLARMQEVLEKMQKLADMNEIRARLKRIIQETEQLQEEIRRQQEEQFKQQLQDLEKLKGLED